MPQTLTPWYLCLLFTISQGFLKANMQVLSMDVDTKNEIESEYRVALHGQVKYILMKPGIYDVDTLSFPPALFDALPQLPDGDWLTAVVSRNDFGDVSFELLRTPLRGVQCIWHSELIDVLALTPEERLDPRVQLVRYGSVQAVAKIARFEFEIPQMEVETTVYRTLEGSGIAPKFLGHLVENGRIMGLLIDYVQGRNGFIHDLEACQEVVARLHSLGIVHGDLNRYNFIVSPLGVKLIDFENSSLRGDVQAMAEEFAQLSDQLTEETGRGGTSTSADESVDLSNSVTQ